MSNIANFFIIISSIVFELFIINRYTSRKIIPIQNNKLFFKLLKVLLVLSCSNLITIIAGSLKLSNLSITIHYITDIIYYTIYEVSFIYFADYLLWNSGKKTTLINSKLLKIVVATVSLIIITFMNSNQLLFYVDRINVFHFKDYFNILSVFPIIIMSISVIKFLKYNYNNMNDKNISILLGCILIMLGMLSVNIKGSIYFIDFFLCLCVFIIYITAENPEFFISSRIRCYNSMAFEELINESIAENKEFYMYGLEIRNFTTLRSRLGNKILFAAIADFARWIEEFFPEGYLFFTDNGYFNILFFEKIEEKKYNKFIKISENRDFNIDKHTVYFWTRNIFIDCRDELCKSSPYIINGEIYAIENAPIESKNIIVDRNIYEKVDHEKNIYNILENCIHEKNIEIYMQPIYRTSSRKIEGGEILTRIQSKEHGLIMPIDFIPLAEKSGMIIQLSYIIFEKTCEYIAKNHLKDLGIDFININCSPIQFQDLNLAEKLKSISDKYKIDFSIFKFEVTESFISDNAIMKIHINSFKKYGASIAMDDFGKESSNFARLKDFDFDIIKLDMSLVWSYFDSDDTMLEDIVAMFKKDNFKIVAEGVEKEEMVDILSDMGCDYLQGYYFSKPLPANEFLNYVKKFNSNSKS